MTKANIFIVGAPKCGTTTLSAMLNGHSNIQLSHPKEPMYFCSDLDILAGHMDGNDYFKRFFKSDARINNYVDASALYLYSKQAASSIHAYNPSAKIIVILRNPVEQAHAFHAELLRNGNEDVSDFKTAWNLIPRRKNGEDLPKNVLEPSLLFYDDIIQYATQLHRFVELFGSENIKVLLFEEFFHSPKKGIQDLMTFLELPFEDSMLNIEKMNANTEIKSFLINSLFNNKKLTRHPVYKLMRTSFGGGLGIQKKINALNRVNKARPALDAETIFCVKSSFEGQIDDLSKLIQTDLRTTWSW